MIGLVAIALTLQQGSPPEVVTRARVDPSRGVDFHALIVPETVYVGQQATYQLGVFFDQDTRQRIRRNPEFQPPETRSLLSYDLRERAMGTLSATIAGRPYDVHLFQRALFPLTPGRYPIPAARLTYSVPQSTSFFSRDESFALRSEAVAFVAIEPPRSGRPSDWTGAVGAWRANARVDTLRGRAGEPFVLTLRVEGQGNVTLLPRPQIAVSWARVVNADERVRLDSTLSLLGGWKEFDWLITPRESGSQRMPALRYAYFNPRTREYEHASTTPFEVQVADGEVAESATSDRPPPPTARDIPRLLPATGGELPPPIDRSPIVMLLVVVAPALAFAAWLVRRPRRVRPPPTARQRLAVIGARQDADAVREVRRALTDGITQRTRLDARLLTASGAWTMALRKEGMAIASAAATEALLAALDSACFDVHPPRQPSGASWAQQAQEVLDLIDDECVDSARRPGRRSAGKALATIATRCIAALVVPFALATAQGNANDAFALGATAYAGGDYVRATRHFADAARTAPRSPAAWMNMGTSAIMAYDTATAVVGWQRALRLTPTDAEPRARLRALRVPQEGRYAGVPPIPGSAITLLAVAIWVVGWGMTARQCLRRQPARRIGAVTAVLGGLAFGAAYRIQEQRTGRRLVVVTDPTTLRALPSLGAESRSTPLVGEVGVILERRGVWVHLRLDGARDGWLPLERVAALGGD